MRILHWQHVQLVLGLALSVLGSNPASAVDGVIEINQARALAGGVTAGDTPGFPVTINGSGSYRLTGNLDVPADTTGIDSDSLFVSLDLNGFSISSAGGTGNLGVTAAGMFTLKNGVVRGFGSHGIVTYGPSRIEGVLVHGNGGFGIILSGGGIGTGNTVWENGAGIGALSNSSVIGNTISHNTNQGIQAGTGVLVMDNVVTNNGGVGLELDSVVGYKGNVLNTNNGGGPQVSGGIQIGQNVCGSSLCP